MFHFYLKQFKDDGTYEAEFTEITDSILGDGVGALLESLDNTEFDIGVYKNSNVNLKLDNRDGRFDDVGSTESIFRFRRSGSLVKITWEKGDSGAPICGIAIAGQSELSEEVDLFIGLINDKGADFNPVNDIVRLPVLGRLSIFDETDVPFSDIANGETISTIMKTILNQTKITDVLTFSAANINPGVDVVVDDVSSYENETVKPTLDELLLISNSVLYVSGNDIIVAPRTFEAASSFTFFGQDAISGAENIEKISKIKNGINQVFNLLKWDDTSISASDSTSVLNFGVRPKKFSVDSITNNANRQILLDNILSFFKDKKQELIIKTGLDYNSLDLTLLDRVTIDYPTVAFTTGAPIPKYGISVYGVAQYPKKLSNFTIDNVDYGILHKKIGLKDESIEFRLREI